MKQPDFAGTHELPCDIRGGRVKQEFTVLGNTVPVAEIPEEAPAAVIVIIPHERAGGRHVAFDALRQGLHPGLKNVSQNDNAIFLECVDIVYQGQ